MTGEEAYWAGLGPEDCEPEPVNEMPIIAPSKCRMCQAKDSRIEFLTKEIMRLRSNAEIEAEIKKLSGAARDYDTERQSNDTCVAAGAHDALRWALGLAENPISDTFVRSEREHEASAQEDSGSAPLARGQ